jgi:hypothetical protein
MAVSTSCWTVITASAWPATTASSESMPRWRSYATGRRRLQADPGYRGSNTPSWGEVEAEVPELAALARRFLDAHVHKTLATLRRDGSPRVSGTEVDFAEGELWLGSMWHSLKALDMRRDPRFALHSGSADSPEWTGDAKVGRVRRSPTLSGRPPLSGVTRRPVPRTCSAPTSRSWSSCGWATPRTISSSSRGTPAAAPTAVSAGSAGSIGR